MQAALDTFSMEKVKLWKKLTNVYGDPRFQEFQKVLSDSMMLIDWLRKVTHGMVEIVY